MPSGLLTAFMNEQSKVISLERTLSHMQNFCRNLITKFPSWRELTDAEPAGTSYEFILKLKILHNSELVILVQTWTLFIIVFVAKTNNMAILSLKNKILHFNLIIILCFRYICVFPIFSNFQILRTKLLSIESRPFSKVLKRSLDLIKNTISFQTEQVTTKVRIRYYFITDRSKHGNHFEFWFC